MNIKAITSLDKVESITKHVLSSGCSLSIDLETTALDPWRDKIVGVGLSWDKRAAFYVPTLHQYDQPFDGEKALSIMKPMLEIAPLILYNAAFELEFLRNQMGIDRDGSNCVDTGFLAYVNAEYERLSLEYVAGQEFPDLGVSSYKKFMSEHNLNWKKNNIGEAPIGPTADYCGRDTLANLFLFEEFYPKLKDNRIYKLEKETLPAMLWLRRSGVLVDKEFFTEEQKRLEEELESLKKVVEVQVSEQAGEKINFNVNSSQQLGNVLFKVLNIPTKSYTPTNQYSTNKGVLSSLKWKYPIVRNIISYKEVKKRATTYYKNYLPFIQSDGRIHASYNQTGVPGGRTSCSDPNLQNIPREKSWDIYYKRGDYPKILSNMRRGFTVPEGSSMLAFDFSQLEARVAAGITKEPILLEAFRKGIDYHTKTASLVFGTPVESVTKEQRYLGKTINFALSYGMGVRKFFFKLQEEVDVSYARAKEMRQRYLDSYPQMFREAEMIARNAQRCHFVHTLWGRKVTIFGFAQGDERSQQEAKREAYNQEIQGTAADVAKRGMVQLYRMVKKDYGLDVVKYILFNHDEYDFEVPKEVELSEFVSKVRKCVDLSIEGFPELFVEAKRGSDWGSLKKFEETSNSVVSSGAVKRKTFILELPSGGVKRTQKQVEDLKNLIESNPGENVIVLKMGDKEQPIPHNTSIGIESRERIILLIGGKFYERT